MTHVTASHTPRRRPAGRGPALALAGALAFALAAAGPLQAEPLRRVMQNPRGLALGGTGMSYANDEMALYYNPAGLGSIDNWWVELAPVAAEASPAAIELIQDKAESGDSDVGTVSDLATVIDENIGEDLHLRGMGYPTAIVNLVPGVTLGAGAFYEAEADLLFSNPQSPEADAFYRVDQGQAYGFSFPILDGKILLGLGARSFKRETGQGTITSARLLELQANDQELDLEQELNIVSGTGVGYDAGMIYRLEVLPALRGQFALSYQNIGGADLGEAGEVPQELSVGYAFQPRFGPLYQTLFAVEYRDVTNELTDDTSTGKRTHVGLEVGIFPMDKSTSFLTLRAGYGSGGASWGVELAAWHTFSIQYVQYVQEYGEGVGDDPRDRRILQVNLLGF